MGESVRYVSDYRWLNKPFIQTPLGLKDTQFSPLAWLLSLNLSQHLFWLFSLAALRQGSTALLRPMC